MRKLLRLPAVVELVGLKRTQIDEAIRRGEFPKPIKLTDTGRARAWLEQDLEEWLEARVAKRDEAA
jgi:prophage regulatory protein